MSSFLRVLILILPPMLLAACGGGHDAPKNLSDACAIVRERPDFLRAMNATEKKWGVPVPVQMAIIYQESKFVGNIRTPMTYAAGIIPMGRQSSAYGYAQALDGTWREYQEAEGRRSAKRHNIKHATDFMGWYMTKTQRETGVDLTDPRNQYLAYHEGQAGYNRGTYNRKSWLLRVADEVAERAQTYDAQLRACGKR